VVHFDLSTIPAGSTVTAVKLRLWALNRVDLAGQSVHVHALNEGWSEDVVAWIKRTSPSNWSTAGGSYGAGLTSKALWLIPVNGQVEFTIPAATVQGWIDNPASNHGLLIKPTADGSPGSGEGTAVFASSEYSVVSRRPKLVVTYLPFGSVEALAGVVSPAEHDVTRPGHDLEFRIEAIDPNGTLTNAQVLAGADVIADGLTSPCSFTWRSVPTGEHNLTVKAWSDGGAVRTSAPVPIRSVWTIYEADMSANPGWTLGGAWGYGRPQGRDLCEGYPDPTEGYTGVYVVGYNLAGPYRDVEPAEYATTPAVDCGGFASTRLEFRYWLGVEGSFADHATVQVSSDGSSWSTLWSNPFNSMAGGTWRRMSLDISAVADGESTVYVRWGMGPCDWSEDFCGWNIDDVRITGVRTVPAPDDDGDTIGDEWEEYYLGGSVAAPDGDDDKDGASNLAEWRAGTNPSDASDRLRCGISFEGGDTVITFPRAPVGPFHTGYTRTYSILSRDELRSGSWYVPAGGADIPATPGEARVNLGAAGRQGNYGVSVKIE